MEEPLGEERNRVSLEDFAKVHPPQKPGRECWTCTIKERREIDEARRNGTHIPLIRRWLIEVCGYSEGVATMSKLKQHFSTNRHHER